MMYLTQVYNDFTLTISTVYIFMEISTIFSTPRWLMFDHGVMGSSIFQAVNSVGLFVSFFCARILF
jgi:hypothetical protein